jgi:EAL domain-containing protein (putative c-di-GMP-specific phosphodiesterase class I)
MVDRKRLIPAGEFVLAAEKFGSIREIDRWVVGRAIEIAARGHAVDVNLSVCSADDEMLDRIRGELEETDARASDLGCRIALDGFVTGASARFC